MFSLSFALHEKVCMQQIFESKSTTAHLSSPLPSKLVHNFYPSNTVKYVTHHIFVLFGLLIESGELQLSRNDSSNKRRGKKNHTQPNPTVRNTTERNKRAPRWPSKTRPSWQKSAIQKFRPNQHVQS